MEQEEQVSKVKEKDTSTRKDQKRLKAELRQKKYNATKEISKKIQAIEQKIDVLEAKEDELKKLLSDSSIYNNHKTAVEKTTEYNDVQKELEKCLIEWENLSKQLHEIEQQFTF